MFNRPLRVPRWAPQCLGAVTLSLPALLLLACSPGTPLPDGLGAARPIPPSVAPVDANAPQAFTENTLLQEPNTLVRPEHVVLVRLEAVNAGPASANEPPVHSVRYYIPAPAQLTLHIHESAQTLQRLVLKNSAGKELARHDYGADPTPVRVSAGVHVLELHRAPTGGAALDEEVIFVRPIFAAATDKQRATAATVAQDVATIEAGHNCENCNFSGADLSGENLAGLNLSGSNFTLALLNGTVFDRAVMTNCQLVTTYTGQTSFAGATLTNAKFDGTFGSGLVFSSANLDGATFNPAAVPAHPAVSIQGSDFDDASVRQAQFHSASVSAATFRGADLTGADFTPVPTANSPTTNATACDFTRSPTTGKATQVAQAKFAGALLGQADLHDLDLAGLDFSTCELSGADLSDTSLRGANLSNANLTGANLTASTLSGAQVAGLTFTGANLTYATLQPMQADIFNGQDLTGCNFTGVFLDGFDLSHANFSPCVLSEPNLGAFTSFALATLSDPNGTSGINLTGQVFPPGYTAFQGADLSYAVLNNVNLYLANLQQTKLENAQLVGATLTYAFLYQANMSGLIAGVAPNDQVTRRTDLSYAYMSDANLNNADLRSAKLTNAYIYDDQSGQPPTLQSIRLDSAHMENAVLNGASISGSLVNASLASAQLVNCTFDQADLTGATLDGAYLEGADFDGATSVQSASFANAVISTASQCAAGQSSPLPDPICQCCSFPYQDSYTPCNYSFGATQLGAIVTDSTVTCPNANAGPCGTPASWVAAQLPPLPPPPQPKPPALP